MAAAEVQTNRLLSEETKWTHTCYVVPYSSYFK